MQSLILIKRRPGKQQRSPRGLQETLVLELLHCSVTPLWGLSRKTLLRIEVYDMIKYDIISMLLEYYASIASLTTG